MDDYTFAFGLLSAFFITIGYFKVISINFDFITSFCFSMGLQCLISMFLLRQNYLDMIKENNLKLKETILIKSQVLN
jgi:hypothetical protein